jgi:hypothetical protein
MTQNNTTTQARLGQSPKTSLSFSIASADTAQFQVADTRHNSRTGTEQALITGNTLEACYVLSSTLPEDSYQWTDDNNWLVEIDSLDTLISALHEADFTFATDHHNDTRHAAQRLLSSVDELPESNTPTISVTYLQKNGKGYSQFSGSVIYHRAPSSIPSLDDGDEFLSFTRPDETRMSLMFTDEMLGLRTSPYSHAPFVGHVKKVVLTS